MTQDQFDYLNCLRNRLAKDHDKALPYSRAELADTLRDLGYAEDAQRVMSDLPDFVRVGREGERIEVRGMSGPPGGVVGWLYPDESCRLKTG